jgi:hypothetical protein
MVSSRTFLSIFELVKYEMLVLLKTAFYVAGWVMGVNGFGKWRGFFFFFLA